MEETNVFIGRQPIFDRRGNIYGYELLYRNSTVNKFPNIDPKQATLSVLSNTFLSIGAKEIADDRKLFVNFSEELLKEELFLSFNSNVIIIEVLETVLITKEVLKHIKRFKDAGYKIALDDFKMREDYYKNRDIFELVDIIKVDLKNTAPHEQIEIFALRQAYPSIKLLAEKVETRQQREVTEKLSYDLFQGYFYAEPEIITGYDIEINDIIHHQAREALARKDVNVDEVASIIMRDVSLSYKLLRYINSMAVNAGKHVTSIKEAIELIGFDEVRKWLHVVSLRDMAREEGKGDLKALIEFSLLRAKICKLLARQLGHENEDEFFLLGMFSLIDLIMRKEKQDIVPFLQLNQKVQNTLLGDDTNMLPILELAIQLEKLNVEEAECRSNALGITSQQLSQFSQAAYAWLHEVDRT
ncbi:MAG TPA: HDOD domain-containing protein [Pseudogracilibacillus sp.]|nr:HDOD domain-containing protein [Pseudogracilibacillus sp.]